MALINLGDLEREHGNFETGFVHYQKAAELPPLGDADDADGRASHSDEVQGSTGRVGAARGSGWLVEEVGPLIGLSHV